MGTTKITAEPGVPTRAELVERGAEVGTVQHMADGGWGDGKGGDWNAFFIFSDPDGNGWIIRERPAAP